MLATTDETTSTGRRLRVARLGQGPTVVLLHGYPDNLQIWCELAPLLAGAFRVIAFDWPGMGASEAWPGGATPAHMADRLRVLLDGWGVGRVSLLGADMGGQPALAFAATWPERVERLVVMNSLVLPAEETSWEIAVLRRFGWNRFLLRHLAGPVFRRAVATSLPPGLGLPAELRADLWTHFRRPEVRAFIAKMCAGYQGTLPKLAALYPRITCPTLALWGEADRHFPPVHARGLQAAVPRSRLAILPAAEHWMAWYRARDVAQAVLPFLTDAAVRQDGGSSSEASVIPSNRNVVR
jgi:pimeloyl-ACP methyl ester carboxylesterase